MLRGVAILIIIFAKLIVLGHGAVAHDHNDSKHKYSFSNHNHDSQGEPFSDALSEIPHSGEEIAFTNPEKIEIQFLKETITIGCYLFEEYTSALQVAVTYQKNTFPPGNIFLYQLYSYSSNSLRGPPLIVA